MTQSETAVQTEDCRCGALPATEKHEPNPIGVKRASGAEKYPVIPMQSGAVF